jgi:hypothetical protein
LPLTPFSWSLVSTTKSSSPRTPTTWSSLDLSAE